MEQEIISLDEIFKDFPIGSQDGKGLNSEVIVKFFNPTGVGTWYIIEGEKLDNGDYEMFGYCNMGDDDLAEFGTVYKSELDEIKLPMGLKIERDLYLPKGKNLMQILKVENVKIPEYLVEDYNSEISTNSKEKVVEIVRNEYKQLIEETKRLKPEEIIEKSYEIVCCESIMYLIESLDLSEKQCESIIENGCVLKDCYYEWLDTDGNFAESFEYPVNKVINHLVSDYKMSIKDKIKVAIEKGENNSNIDESIDKEQKNKNKNLSI